MKDKTLVIMAGGIGSRYGGDKQLEVVGPNDETIIDYSAFDAIKNGFNKIVFIIREEHYDLIKNNIAKRIGNKAEVKFAFQKNDNIPDYIKVPDSRTKPLGTAHAILCAKDVIDSDFTIINADDFYGEDAFNVISKYMDNMNNEIGIVGYDVLNTLSENGSVKRGVLKVDNGNLLEIRESSIREENNELIGLDLVTKEEFKVNKDDKVSMNMIAFPKSFLNYIEENFISFLENSNLEKDEYLIPVLIDKVIKENKMNVKVVDTTAKWVGVTYKEDKESVVNYINSLIRDSKYNENLWE